MSPPKINKVHLLFPILSIIPTRVLPGLVTPPVFALASGWVGLRYAAMAAGFPTLVISPQALKPPQGSR